MTPKNIILILNIMTKSVFYVTLLFVALVIAAWIYFIAAGHSNMEDTPGALIHTVTSFGKMNNNIGKTYVADSTLAYIPLQNQYKLTTSAVTPLGYYSILIFLLFAAITLSILKGFMNLFKAIKLERPFTPSIIVLLRKLTLLFFAMDLLKIIHYFIFSQFMDHLLPAFKFSLNIEIGTFFITSLITWIISVICQRGLELQTENDLTV